MEWYWLVCMNPDMPCEHHCSARLYGLEEDDAEAMASLGGPYHREFTVDLCQGPEEHCEFKTLEKVGGTLGRMRVGIRGR